MKHQKKIAFLFPGQGAQYTGMARDFFENYSVARQTFEEADDCLKRKLSKIVFEGPDQFLTETKNSQTGIFVASLAILRVIQQLYPNLTPSIAAGLSLGEYTALTAARKLSFEEGLSLVDHRSQFMNDACETTQGTMVVVLGLDAEAIEQLIHDVNMPNDLWAANFNCPGQIVLSGTLKGIEVGTVAAKAKGAKRVLPLQVHGAFHSGLMKQAEERLAPYIQEVKLIESPCKLIMNAPGGPVQSLQEIRQNLIKQVTHPVRWEQGIRFMMSEGVDLFVEIGCGKALCGFNKRIGVTAPSLSIEKVSDLVEIEQFLNREKL